MTTKGLFSGFLRRRTKVLKKSPEILHPNNADNDIHMEEAPTTSTDIQETRDNTLVLQTSHNSENKHSSFKMDLNCKTNERIDIYRSSTDSAKFTVDSACEALDGPGRDFIAELPFEIAVQILAYVGTPSILAQVSRYWNKVSNDPSIWRSMYHTKFPITPSQHLLRKKHIGDWKELYHRRLCLNQNWIDGKLVYSGFAAHPDSVYCIQYDSEKLVSGSRDRTVVIWDLKTRKRQMVFHGHEGSVLCLQYDSNILVTGSSDCRVIIWDIHTGKKLRVLKGHPLPVLDLKFNDKYLVTSSKDSNIRVWDLLTGQLLKVLEGHHAAVNAIHLHGDLLVSASGDNLVKLWDLNTGACIRDFVGHTRSLACVQFDGHIIASGSNDKTIRIWNAQTGECLRVLEGHTDLVRTLCFDGDKLVSGSYDQTIKVWDMKTGRLMCDLADGHASWVFHVQMDPSRVISASQDRQIIVWDFSGGLDVSDFI